MVCYQVAFSLPEKIDAHFDTVDKVNHSKEFNLFSFTQCKKILQKC